MSLLPRRRPARSDCALRCACESLERRCLLAFSIYDGRDAAVGYGPQPAPTAQPEIIVSAEPSAVDSPTPSVSTGVVYANMGTGSGLTATTVTGSGSGTEIGFDDYNTINDANLNMTSFRFIGGVSAVGGQLFFDFHNASNVFVVRLSATLNTAGNNLTWTLTTSPGVNIPDQGFLHVLAASGTTATWRKSNAPPTVGAQDPALGSAGAGQSYKFELTNTPPNAAPMIASLADSPDPVPAGGTFMLTANGVADSDGTIANVKFYRETNGLTGLQTTGTADLLLGTDTTAAPYSLAVSTVGLANGTYTYYAQATDNGALGGNVVSTTNTAGAGSITGTVWNDANDNKIFDVGEGVLAGWTVFLDQNLNHVIDGGEVSTTSNASGVYTFGGLAPDTYFVTTAIPAGWQQTFPGASGQISSAAAGRGVVAAPAAQEHITTTGSDEPIFPTGSSGGEITPSDAQSNPLIHLNNFQADPRFNAIGGQGFSVAVLDTGIKANHAFFGPDANANGVADRIVYQQDFADGDMNANDVNGHGTNVASIVGSSDSTHGGMAPAVNLIALKVFTDADAGSFSFVEAALQWCIAHAAEYNLAAINMSLGDNKNYIAATTSASNGINDELAALAGMNVMVVSAAGNDYATFGSAQGVAYPAADPNALAVSAVFDANVGGLGWGSGASASSDFTTAADRVTSFSQRSTTLTDIFAPGALITGAGLASTTATSTMGGTSQASPHIAGIAALAQQLAMRDLHRRLTMAEFKSLMNASGFTIIDGDDEDYSVVKTNATFKRVDVQALGEAIRAMATSPYTHTVTISPGENAAGINFGNKSTDITPPTADVVDVSPDPRLTSVGTVTINFSEPVTGVGASDFSLTRDGAAIAISAAPFSQVTPSQYTIDLTSFTEAAGKYILTLNAGAAAGIKDMAGNDFVTPASDDWIRNAIDGTAGNDTIRLVRAGGGTAVNVFINNATATPNYAVNIANLGSNALHVQGLAGNDTINIDFASGVAAPSAGLNINGGAHTAGDTLIITGAAASETATFNTTNFNFGATTITYGATEAFTFNGGAGNDTLNVNAGTYNFNADASPGTANLAVTVAAPAIAHFNTSQHLAGLTVNGSADLTAGPAKVLVTKALAVTGKLNLRNHDLIYNYSGATPLGAPSGGIYSGVTGMIQSAHHAGAWDGNGITTTEADVIAGLTTLGVAEAAAVFGLGAASTEIFAGETVDATCVLIKYTYAGDANMDGIISGDDYSSIDFNVGTTAHGYYNGDFNYDGIVSGDDYSTIDFNYAAQGLPL